MKFNLFGDGAYTVRIDPAAVVAVVDERRQPSYGFERPVAVIHMSTGEKFVVDDEGRKVGEQIELAQIRRSLPPQNPPKGTHPKEVG